MFLENELCNNEVFALFQDHKGAIWIGTSKGFKDIPIIVMTAEAMKGDMEKCLKVEMNDYLPKPIKRENVFKVIQKWCLQEDLDI